METFGIGTFGTKTNKKLSASFFPGRTFLQHGGVRLHYMPRLSPAGSEDQKPRILSCTNHPSSSPAALKHWEECFRKMPGKYAGTCGNGTLTTGRAMPMPAARTVMLALGTWKRPNVWLTLSTKLYCLQESLLIWKAIGARFTAR